MAKNIKFTLAEARAICDGLNQRRMERIQGKMQQQSDQVEDSLRYKDDFILYDNNHEENEVIDRGTES